MIALDIVENKTNKVLAQFPVGVNDPEPLFVKDRATKKRYVMIRTKGSAPDEKNQLFEVEWDQYSPVYFRLVSM
jgi:hypothetical protein